MLLAESGRALHSIPFGAAVVSGTITTLSCDLWDTSYAADFTPLNSILPYTRAYVHHLLTAHEMLATVALSVHNVAVYQEFMSAIRQSISDGTFANDHTAFAKSIQGRAVPS